MKIACWLAALTLPGATAAAAQPARETIAVAQGADPAIWEGAETSGPIVHRATRVALPAQVEGFDRFKVASASATDVFASYRRKDGSMETTASVYLFKPGALPEHKLKGSVQSFAALNGDAFLWSAGPLDIAADPKLHARKLAFHTGVGAGAGMEYIYFVPLGRWTVKIRGTIGGLNDGDPEAKLDAFVRALPWPAILAANGPCEGTACSAPPYDPIRSHIGHLMLGKLVAVALKPDPKKEGTLAVVGKIKGPKGEVEVRGSDAGAVLFVARVPKVATYRLVALPDVFKELFQKGYGIMSLDKPLYALTVESGDETVIPRFYNGRPPLAAFSDEVADLTRSGVGSPFLSAADYAGLLAD